MSIFAAVARRSAEGWQRMRVGLAAGKPMPPAAPGPEDRSDVQPGGSAAEPIPRRAAARRFAPLMLVAGAIAAASILVPHFPEERRVDLRLDDASSIVAVELSVARASDGEPVHGNTWHFLEGSAPASLSAAMNLADGRYEVDVTVQRTQGRHSIHRVISVSDSDLIAISVPRRF
jgi:hypothetical protein